MPTPDVEFDLAAVNDVRGLPAEVRVRIVRRIEWLAEHWEDIRPEPLSGTYRRCSKLRVGDWRVIYHVDEGPTIVVWAVRHRSEAYR